MSSFNNTPFALRTRGPLPGFSATQSNETVYAQPTPIHPISTPIVASVEKPASPEPVQREWTPEPVNITELERTPSPYIKKEPKDKNTYSKFVVPDDNDEYDPRRSTRIAAQARPSTAYDPARPVPQRSNRLDRILSSKDGKTFEPPTVCFTDQYRNQQFVHILKCHGEIETEKPHACGPNCATVIPDDKTLFNMWPLECTHEVCVEKREKRRAAVFMPKKRARTSTPATSGVRGATPQVGRRSMVPGASGASRRSARNKTHDEITAELNEQVETDPAFAQLVKDTDDAMTRRKSKRHAGYAYMKEIKEDAMAERLFDVTGGLDLGLDDKPTLKRELKKLHVDGTEKLRGMGGTFGFKRKAEDEAAEFNAHDKPVGAENDKDRPWSYANPYNPLPGKKAIRNEEAGMFSMPETRYNDMLAEENDVVVEREDNVAHRLPRSQYDEGDGIDDDEDPSNFRTVEACQVCEVSGDGQLQECTRCHHHFHPVCAGFSEGVDDISLALGSGAKSFKYFCDGQDCNKSLDSIRYKCINVACQDHDYCIDCFRKRTAAHVLEMAEQGEDPAAHGFIAVRGDFADALTAAMDAAEYGFVCSTCKDADYAQKVAKKMFGKKKLDVATIRAEVNEQRKTEKKALEKAGTAEAVRDRIAKNKSSGIRKPSLSASRRSGRLAGSGLGSKRSDGFKLKLLNSKQLAELESLKLTADSPMLIAAKAQLPSIPEEADVEMGDGEIQKLGEAEDLYDPELFGVE